MKKKIEMSETTSYASYLVRVWWGQDNEATPAMSKWKAEVELIQTGETRQFSALAELTLFFEDQSMRLKKVWVEGTVSKPDREENSVSP